MKDPREIRSQANQAFLKRYWPCVLAGLAVWAIKAAISVLSSGWVAIIPSEFHWLLRAIDRQAYTEWIARQGFLGEFGAVSLVLSMLLLPMNVGLSGFFLKAWRGDEVWVGMVFTQAREWYWRKLGGLLWASVWLLLWFFIGLLVMVAVFVVALPIPTWALRGPLGMVFFLLSASMAIVRSYAYWAMGFLLADCPNITARDALRISIRMTHRRRFDIFLFQLRFLGWQILSIITLGLAGHFFVNPYFDIAQAGLYEELKRIALESGNVTMAELNGDKPLDRKRPMHVVP